MRYLLLILFIVLFIPQKSEAQGGTIVDYGTYLSFNFATGDTIAVGKEQVTLVRSRRGVVFIITSHYWTNDKKPTALLIITPSDFGYASSAALQDYLAVVFFKAYRETYSYDNGNLDTVSYYQGANLQYQIVYGYTDALVTSKSIITP